MSVPRGGPRARWILFTVAMALVATVFAAPSHAQILYGSIVGQVTDPQKAALPGVTVTATNTGTNFKTEAVTDGTGNFVFRNLAPGRYDVTAVLTGFKELRQTGLDVTAGNPRRIDLTLQLGGMTETIEVIAESTLIKTEKADLSTELSSKAVTTLPLNQYRNYQTLLNLVPGASPTESQNAEIDTPGRSLRTYVNGTQPNSNTTRVDGAVSVNIWLPHHAGYISPAETIDTVNISTNSFDADTGMAAGAAQTVVTKSGTNELRGSGFWFHNGDNLNANTFFNEQQTPKIPKAALSRNIYGGTLGGPVVKDKFFFFGSYENFRDRRGTQDTYGVPTAKMRAGDFSEVAAQYSAFRLYDPATGGAGGVGRTQFANFAIPANRISPIAQAILALYPTPDSRDLNNNKLLDDYLNTYTTKVDRANYDLKLTWQRSAAHQIWGKFSMLDAEVNERQILGIPWQGKGSIGDTRVYVGGLGHTWTLSPTTVLDGNFGYNRQDQTVLGPDYGENWGLKLNIPGTNDPNDVRASGMPRLDNGYAIGQPASWMPLFRKEITYSFSSALTKVFSKHDMRTGVDIVKMNLDHRQAEVGYTGLRGGMTFGSGPTSAPGYISPGWNNFASFLLGLPTQHGKDVQTETMTGREWQTAFYVRDRWRPTEKLTVNAGLRLEYYPLMSRANSGIERLDYSTWTVLLGGRGSTPKDVGLELKEWYLAPRVGASYRLTENTVFRAGYGRTVNPLPWSRPMRGSFPYDIYYSNSAEQYMWVGSLQTGIPTVPIPNYQSGSVRLPAGVQMRSPNPTDVNRAIIQQWNVAVERRIPLDISVEVAYVGTRTDGGYADRDLNYGELGGGQTSRKLYQFAGTAAVNDWSSQTRARYHGLQIALNRPFKAGLMLKGAYTLSRAKNMADEDGWTSLKGGYQHPQLYELNYALAGYDRTHNFQLGFVYELPFFRGRTGPLGVALGGWQVNGIFSAYSGTPFTIGGSNPLLNCPSCGSVTINMNGDPTPTYERGNFTQTFYDKSIFSQPTGLSWEGFGNSGILRFRRPPQWNLDFSLFKGFQIGRVRPELRIQVTNLMNHVNWGSPNTSFTSPNFLLFSPGSSIHTPRQVQIGLRVGF